MKDQEKQSLRETKRVEKRSAEDAELLDKEKVRKKAYLLREEAIEKASKAKETKRAGTLATEEIDQLAKDQARRKAYVAREQTIAQAQEARKLKAKSNHHS